MASLLFILVSMGLFSLPVKRCASITEKYLSNMTLTEARKVLERYNNWRRYDGPLEQSPTQPEPKEVGEAIDVAIEILPKESTRPTAEERLEAISKSIESAKGFNPFNDRSRSPSVVCWRHAIWAILVNEGYRIVEIARATKYNHATIWWGVRRFKDYLDYGDKPSIAVWEDIQNII